jgi:hypothetical protein
MLPPKLATQMLRENVASERTSRFRPFKTQKLRPRVVTQQNFFFTAIMRPTRLR